MSKQNFGQLYFVLAHPKHANGRDRRESALRERSTKPVSPAATPRHARRWSTAKLLAVVSLAAVAAVSALSQSRDAELGNETTQSRDVKQPPLESVPATTRIEIAAAREVATTPAPLVVGAIAAVTTPNRPATKRIVDALPVKQRLYPARSAFELRKELERLARDIGRNPLPTDETAFVSNDSTSHRVESRKKTSGSRNVTELLAARPDLIGLPFRNESECSVAPDRLPIMKNISQTVSRTMAQSREVSESIDTSALLREHLTRSTGWKSPHAVPTLVQTLQIEDDLVRLKLVQVLASVSGPEASRALVERALFDLSPDVRDEAIAALRARPLTEFQERLLQGFRYPWPEAARHAAEVSVELNALELIEPLTALPALPDPSRPQHDAHGHWTTTELVRINHLGNCTLCHARANKPDQGFVVSVPISGRPLQPLYYDMSPGEDAIQADVVFLYQDFSLIHVTTAFQPWPSEQRYDYLVQTRRLTEREIADAKLGGESATEHSETTSYPQRDAVLLTLARLKDRRP